ncbi:MAG: hypothetical protein U1D67_00460 [Dehalococcoidia bacterium]|nr:hypothetical protein [Dehalococcoidia bacterium]
MGKKAVFLIFSLIAILIVGCGPKVTQPPAAPTQAGVTPRATMPPPGVATPRPVTTPTPSVPTPRPTATSSAPFYQGKTIEFIVESAAGGGTDTIARITSGIMPKYIPGNPKIVVRNQPGAAGGIANNIFYTKTKPDGFTLLQNSSSPISMQLRDRSIIKYDLTKYRHVGNVMRAESVIMVSKGQKARLTDPGAKPLVVGTKEGEETWNAILLWGREFLGWNVRWITGFGGTSEMELAFRRGEIDIFGTSNAFIIQRMKEEGLAETITTIGTLKDGKFHRRPDFPDVPVFTEVLGDKKPTGVPWQAYLAWIGPSMVDKSLAAPPNTPDNIMNILTESYAKMAKDTKFDELMRKIVSEAYDVGIGKETDNNMKEILDAPEEALEYGRNLQKKFDIIK